MYSAVSLILKRMWYRKLNISMITSTCHGLRKHHATVHTCFPSLISSCCKKASQPYSAEWSSIQYIYHKVYLQYILSSTDKRPSRARTRHSIHILLSLDHSRSTVSSRHFQYSKQSQVLSLAAMNTFLSWPQSWERIRLCPAVVCVTLQLLRNGRWQQL